MSIPNVLVVDDDVTVCRILSRMLSDEQYQVQISQSVTDAVAVIEKKPFDVYVLDFKLPDGTGLDVAERIRSTGSGAPIILISGYEPSGVASKAEKLRIFDVIEKPFSRETVCNAVKKAIESAKTADQHLAGLLSTETAQPTVLKKPFPKVLVIGAIALLLVCLAVYLLIHGV